MNFISNQYPTTVQIYGLTYSVAYIKDVCMRANDIATDTDNHILWIYNPTTIEAIESAVNRAERQFKGCIDDYVVQHH